MQNFSKETYPYGLNIVIVALLLVFSFFAPGQNIGAVISLLIIAYARKQNLSKNVVLIFCVYVLVLSFIVKYNILQQRTDDLLKWLAISQETIFIGIFLLIFSQFSEKKLSNYGHIVSIVVMATLFQEFFVTTLVFLLEKKSINYIHFSIPEKNYLQLMQKMSENTLAAKENAVHLAQSLNILTMYWGALCAVMNGCYFLIFARLLGKKYLLQPFSFRRMLLPKWILSIFLASWSLFLLQMDAWKTYLPAFFQQIMASTEKIFVSILIVATSLFFLQGIAVLVHFFSKMMHNFAQTSQKKFKVFKHFQPLIPMLFLLALFLFLKGNKVALLTIIFATGCLGVLEMWFDFRKILQKNVEI